MFTLRTTHIVDYGNTTPKTCKHEIGKLPVLNDEYRILIFHCLSNRSWNHGLALSDPN